MLLFSFFLCGFIFWLCCCWWHSFMSLMLLLTFVVCLSWGGLPLKKLISWCCVYVCRIVALHILLKVLVSEMWGSKHQCTVNLQLFTQSEMAGMFLALAILQPNRDSALLLLKSMACYMKVMTLKNPYKTYLISRCCSQQKSWT